MLEQGGFQECGGEEEVYNGGEIKSFNCLEEERSLVEEERVRRVR